MSLDGSVDIPISQALVDSLTADKEHPPRNIETEGHPYLEGVWFDELSSDTVDIILSSEYAYTWLDYLEIRRSTSDKELAIRTKFGWTLIGGHRDGGGGVNACYKTAIEVDDMELKCWTNRLYNEDFPVIAKNEKHMSLEDEHAMQQMKETIQFDKDLGH